MPALLLSLPGQSGEKFANVQPPKFDNYVWDIDTVKITPTGDETIAMNDDGVSSNAALVNTAVEISGTLKTRQGGAPLFHNGFLIGKAGGSMEGEWMRITSAEITEVIGTDKRPSKVDITLRWTAKMAALWAADTGLYDLDTD